MKNAKTTKTDTYGKRLKHKARQLWNQRSLQTMIWFGVVWLIIFCYVPMYGIIISFTDYRPGQPFFSGEWVGLKHFAAFLKDSFAIESLWNTLIISGLKLLFCFPAPIVFAILLNEIGSVKFRKFMQSISYLPFFISWVVVAGMLRSLLSVDGVVNDLALWLGISEERTAFLTKPELFRLIAVLSDLWKGVGWGSILYSASIAGIPQDQYEAAYIDGANRLQMVLHITLPSMIPTIIIMLIFNVAGILGSNFEQHLLLGNQQVLDVSSTIDTYVYSMGLQTGRYSYATAINLGRSVIAFMLMFAADRFAKLISDGEQGVF